MSEPPTQPVQLRIERNRHLEIHWTDGERCTIPLTELRKACPCAGCRESRTQHESNPLAVTQPVPNPQDMVVVDKAELTGNYALWIRWKDGHDTGIYDFALLRELGRRFGPGSASPE